MDLRQLSAAVRNHRVVAVLGVAAAIGLAFLADVRVSPFASPHLTYRKPVVWSSRVTLQLTEAGFPEGRVQDVGSRRAALVSLAPLYARLANTDPVKARMRRLGPVLGGVKVEPLVDANNVSLPLIRISSFAFRNTSAVTRARRQADAFIAFLAQQQRANKVLPKNRVELKVVSGPSAPAVVVPRKITLPVVVFLSMLIVTGALILTLENRARRRPAAQAAPDVLAVADDVEHRVAGDGRGDTAARPERPPAPVASVKPVADVSPVTGARAVPLSRPERTLGSESTAENGKPRSPETAATEESTPSKAVGRAGASRRGRRG
jgi:hypothetical protein